jgi:hypothetical protein
VVCTTEFDVEAGQEIGRRAVALDGEHCWRRGALACLSKCCGGKHQQQEPDIAHYSAESEPGGAHRIKVSSCARAIQRPKLQASQIRAAVKPPPINRSQVSSAFVRPCGHRSRNGAASALLAIATARVWFGPLDIACCRRAAIRR